nr:ACT domain-containing protein [Thaumasiovibrio subtropicus]
MKHLVISVIGQDSPGLVDTLSDTVFQHHGNWLASSLTQLAGQFAGILQISVEEQYEAALITALKSQQAFHIHVVDGNETPPAEQTIALTVSGNDRRGIVNQVSHLLGQNGINISKLKTETKSAPAWGYPLFYAYFQLETKTEIDLDEIQSQLEQLADDLTIDFD